MSEANISEISVQEVSVTEAQTRAEIDIQVSTAKRFPRNVDRSIQSAIATVTRNKEVAEGCMYSLPRGGKSIQGPSVHLARVVAAEYKNLRVDSRVVEIGHTMLTAQAVCMDLESNFAVRTEVKRRIIDKHGNRFKEDMIIMTANAALSIASRNAIFQVIPRLVTDQIFDAVKKTLVGNLSDEQKLISKRTEVLGKFDTVLNVKEEEILDLLGLETINQIKETQILELLGVAQAIKDGDTTVAQAFGRDVKKKDAKDTNDMVADIKKKSEAAESKKKPATKSKSDAKDNSDIVPDELFNEHQTNEDDGSGDKE